MTEQELRMLNLYERIEGLKRCLYQCSDGFTQEEKDKFTKEVIKAAQLLQKIQTETTPK